jgi:NDP-sugar pyrophosphorylase family protein
MTLVVAAGGIGSRVRELTGDVPKCLYPILGKPILFHLVDKLSQAMDLDRVVVVGKEGNPYGERIADALKRYLLERGSEVSLVTTAGKGVGHSLWAGVQRALDAECKRAVLTVSDTLVEEYGPLVSSSAPIAIGISPNPAGPKQYTLVGVNGDLAPQFEPSPTEKVFAVSGVYAATGESLALFSELFREAARDPLAYPDISNEKGEFRVTWVWKEMMARTVQTRCELVGNLAELNTPSDLAPMIEFLRRSSSERSGCERSGSDR